MQTYVQTDIQIHRQADIYSRQSDRQTDRLTNIQKYRQIERLTDRHTDI